MELDIYKQSTPETPHPTSCESSRVSMRKIESWQMEINIPSDSLQEESCPL